MGCWGFFILTGGYVGFSVVFIDVGERGKITTINGWPPEEASLAVEHTAFGVQSDAGPVSDMLEQNREVWDLHMSM